VLDFSFYSPFLTFFVFQFFIAFSHFFVWFFIALHFPPSLSPLFLSLAYPNFLGSRLDICCTAYWVYLRCGFDHFLDFEYYKPQ
jgi:hypothetical protein